MGLDLIVEGRAKVGHEAEWRRAVEQVFDGGQLTDAELARFHEIVTPAYEAVGAPRVGEDDAADAWIVEARGAKSPDEVAAVLEKFRGYHVLALAKCDGVPICSNGGLYGGVDETSFRGAILSACQAVLPKALIESAWDNKMPEAAVEYGRALLTAAKEAQPSEVRPKRGLLARLGLARSAERLPFKDQVEAVEAAGRWFIFWGERGHPIRAWY